MATRTKTITSSAYVLGVRKANFITDTFKTFLNIITNNVTDPHNPSSDKWIFSAYPEVDISTNNTISQVDYPIIVIDSADLRWDKVTMMKKENVSRMDFSVYSTSKQEADELIEEVIDAIETNRNNPLYKLQINRANLDGTPTDFMMHGSKRIHIRTASFTMHWTWRGSL